LLPELKIKLKGRRLEIVSDVQRYSTPLRRMTSAVLFKRRKTNGIALYVPKVTILKVAAKIKLS
jgi:hypothetical protein